MSGFKDQLGDTLFVERYPESPGHRGVDTSIAAAASIKPHVSRIAQDILDHLKTCGANGATYTEVMRDCMLGAPTVSARLRELALAQKIKRSAERRLTPSGHSAAVYLHADITPSPHPDAVGQAAPSGFSQHAPTRSGAATAFIPDDTERKTS